MWTLIGEGRAKEQLRALDGGGSDEGEWGKVQGKGQGL